MIKREILKNIQPWLGKEKILILNGSRQVGKTTLLEMITKQLEKKSGSKVAYLLADDMENRHIFSSLSSLELYLKQFYNFPEKFIYLMIDEFQAIEKAGQFLKNIFDKHKSKLQLIVSGSSSLEINKNNEFLTGRALQFNIERINFKEYFDYTERVETQRMPLACFADLENFYHTFTPKLHQALGEYLPYGGYPEVITTKTVADKKMILKSIIKTYIEKDIINHLRIENVTGFNNLIKILAAQTGRLVNTNELSNTVNLSINTLKKYLDILVGTYIFDLVTPYYKNIRKELSKMPKAYILDLGIKNYLARGYETDINSIQGEVMENFIYLSLLAQIPKENTHFYRTISGSEIDFVIEKERGVILLEVKYRSNVKLPLAMKNFVEKYSSEAPKMVVVTKNLIKKEDNVYFIPAVLFPFVDILK